MHLIQRMVWLTCLWLALPATSYSQTLKKDYLTYILQAAEVGWQEYPDVIANWKKNVKPSPLWGYDAPAQPIYLADILGFLYQHTHDNTYADKARQILTEYGSLRDAYPKDYWKTRAEYRNGMPALSNFFFMPAYARAYLRIRDSQILDARSKTTIERDLAQSLNYVFTFPEWGAMNRAMLRAEALYYGTIALPQHASAGQWKQLAETLASDSLNQWEIEDSTGYQSVWLLSLFSYAEVSGKKEIFDSPFVRYYLEYLLQLLAPHGNIADFGDSNWNGGWDRYIPVFEKAASSFQNPHYKYVAHQMLVRTQMRLDQDRLRKKEALEWRGQKLMYAGTGFASALTEAYKWVDDSVAIQKPTSLSREVLDDVIGKKVVFRNGWDPTSTFLLLNYRDEGDGGLLQRDYLRQTLSVEEEKMHHGHADENGICLLMSGGSVLLHDGGYRDDLPSGKWGAYRADYFHNRVVARKNKRAADQDLFEFIRNSGAYRKVQTQKIDFLNFKEVDVSRTRVVDSELGYEWDRSITYVKARDFFIVVDGIRIRTPGYYTFANLWHTRKIIEQGKQFFSTAIDAIGNETLSAARSLLVVFPESEAKEIGSYPEKRHYQEETALYQTVSSNYVAGALEFFVTILVPQREGENTARAAEQFKLVKADRFPQAVGIEFREGNTKSVVLVKLDLEMDLARENIRPRYQYELGKVRCGELETDASYVFVRDSQGRVGYSAATFTKLFYRGQTLTEALPTTFPLQLDGAPPRVSLPKWRFWEGDVVLKN